VCGKNPDTAALQDLLVHAQKGISMYAHRARELGRTDPEADRFTLEALFTTVTNVNFDEARIEAMLRKAAKVKARVRAAYEAACAAANRKPETLDGAAAWEPAADRAGLIRQGEAVSIESRLIPLGPDVTGVQELLVYGLKGMAAYADHAWILGQEDDAVYAFLHRALDAITRPAQKLEDLLGLNLECGKVNLRVMELLDAAHTGAYGNPVPTAVRITPVKGKAILVSGHDLKDLEALLRQTEGTGIQVYTHGEMLPAHGYPGLKKYKHLAGNYGGAWQDQRAEFDAFPGAILMTTNCIQMPKGSYSARLFTCGLVAWPGIRHLENRDFAPVLEAARQAPGFPETAPEKTILVGFGHHAVLGVAPQVIEAIRSKALRRFFLIGGCDGAKSGRDYFTQFAEAVPQDAVILTLACGKFRFNKMEFGAIGGIPRLLDMGQCNDAYSAIRVASALADAFQCKVNDLPLSLVLSWYEQKAVCILLTLLHLGIRNIRLGPSLPAFVTPPVLQVLVEKFGIKPTTTVESDLAAALAGA
jgi:hydroxylamine reductase